MKKGRRGPYREFDKSDDTFGSFLRSFRIARRMTQQQYADYLGVSRRSVVAAEQRDRYSYGDYLVAIRRVEPEFPKTFMELRRFDK